MKTSMEEIVPLAKGTLVEMNLLEKTLAQAGIPSQVVGDELAAGLGAILPGTVEVWVTASVAEKAKQYVRDDHLHSAHRLQKEQHQHFPNPVSDPKITPAHGQHRSPQDHRKSL